MKSKGLKRLSARLALAFTLSLGLTPLSSMQAFAAGTFTSVTYNSRTYKLYVPSGYTAGSKLPLVVMMHGCTQDPDQFAAGTEMNNLAETEKFLVIYPDQPSSQNQNKCWNFFETAHQSRGSGEPALIVGMVNQVKSNYSVDNDRVFVTGLSAGGAMTAVLGATYPDVFKAIGVGAGLMYKAATDMNSAFSAMSSGSANDPIATARTAYNNMGTNKAMVPTIVFHGTSDGTVNPKNGDQVITQYAEINDLVDDGSSNDSVDGVADQTISGQASGTSGRAYTRYVYNDKMGDTLLEKYMVTGMGHAWSGGNTAGSYTDPNGPKQSQLTWEFFKAVTTPKAPVTTASPKGGNYLLSTTVSLSVSKEATTYYTLDGSTPTTSSTVYTAPINITADTTLKFFSVDTKGNVEVIQSQYYNIESLEEHKTAPVTTASLDSGSFTTAQTVTLTTDEPADTYYTVDGSTPTTSSTKYSGPITINSTTALKFFSVDRAGNVETVQTRNYEMINYETAYGTATEHYTAGRLDATGYTQMGTKYGYVDKFNLYRVFGTTTWTDIKPSGGTVVNPPADTTAPVTAVSPAGGTYTSAQTVTLTPNETASTYYTVNGTTPTTSSTKYTAPITISANTTLKFFSVDTAGNAEGVKTETYTIGAGTPVDTTAPVTAVNPAGGTYTSAQTVTLTPNETASTYYTIDGTTPTTSSTKYTGAITISANTTLKFFSVDTAGNAEGVKTEVYTINIPTGTVLKSIDAEDGFVGQLAADGMSTTTLKVGDKGMFNANTYYTILSFDTSSLNATNISSAKLRIYRKNLTGNVTGIKVDIKSGFFGTASTLAQTDYSAGASLVDVATGSVPTANNAYVDIPLSSLSLQYINKTGKTQFRLKGVSATDSIADSLEIYGGENSVYAPQLIIN